MHSSCPIDACLLRVQISEYRENVSRCALSISHVSSVNYLTFHYCPSSIPFVSAHVSAWREDK